MSDIFLSYAREDHDRIQALVGALSNQGLSVWWDKEIPAGKNFRDVIAAMMDQCRCVVVVWSKHSIHSHWVSEEADEAVRREILIPVRLDEVMPPMGFRTFQMVDLSGWQGETNHPDFIKLIQDISAVLRSSPGGGVLETPSKPQPEPPSAQPPVAAAGPAPDAPGPRRRLSGAAAVIGLAALVAVVLAAVFIFIRPGPEVQKAALSKEVILPPGPPAGYFVLNSIGRQPDAALRLVKDFEQANAITDDAEWWIANQLSPLTYKVPNPFRQESGDLPAAVPVEFRGERVVRAIRGNPILAIYGTDFSDGRYLLAIAPQSGRIEFAFDFSTFQWPPNYKPSDRDYVKMATTWAHVDKGVLYVAHTHNTYASSSNGYNAFISALDASSGLLLWRSQPLVSNARNFVVREGVIIAGYGFTDEKDYLYVLNQADGRILQKVTIASGPDYLVEKNDNLYVRTYNKDYIFHFTIITPSAGPPKH